MKDDEVFGFSKSTVTFIVCGVSMGILHEAYDFAKSGGKKAPPPGGQPHIEQMQGNVSSLSAQFVVPMITMNPTASSTGIFAGPPTYVTLPLPEDADGTPILMVPIRFYRA